MSIGFALMCRDAAALAEFYRAGLGFSVEADGGLRLGGQRVALVETVGAAYPRPASANDPWFQHFAIVTRDIAAAAGRALAAGATAISTGGPRLLPASSGGVTAWKFRDPEGHPLELLQFPSEATPEAWRGVEGDGNLGIDHSALVVADTVKSVAFYLGLGFTIVGQTHNRGAEQAALDGLAAPDVLVTALARPGAPPPHLELLEYRSPRTLRTEGWAQGDIAATITELVIGGHVTRDPDGHLLLA